MSVKKLTETKAKAEKYQHVNLSLDPLLVSILIISFATRYYHLDHPRAVVFDELHYIKFITLYLKRIFFFDPQPPLGKQLLTLVAYFTDFQGDLSYSRIGEPYKPEVPIHTLRLLPCLAGSLLAPLSYLISLELGFRQMTAALVSLLVITENSLLTQSRFILLDPLLILFSLLSIYFYVKFHKSQSIICLTAASVSAALAACTKYSGFYTYFLLLILASHSWWGALDRFVKNRKLARQTFAYIACLLFLPVAVYIGLYHVHLSWLTKAGPHDSIMTSAFQASLENGLASIIRGQPLEIVHGSQVTLRHTHGRCCWLHSHEHLYPIKYIDNRGSSHQQQVTCYSFKDVNNWWIVKRPHTDELIVTEPHDRIRDGDLVQLVHGMSGRTLNSHDVASAMSPYSQEVSCYVDHNISMPAQDVWQVRLSNSHDTNGYWHTINSQVQLIHFNSSLALRFSGRQLPDWGFHQHEIVADKDLKNDDTIWNVEEHRYTKTEDKEELALELGKTEFLPLEPTTLSFFEKLYELHYKLSTYQQDAIKDHLYACDSPLDWIFQNRGTAYWVDGSIDSNAQIFLIGNTGTSASGLIKIACLLLFLAFHILRRRRQIYSDLTEDDWEKFQFQAIIILGGYLMHLLPYFLYESPLFLQHYLSAIVFKILAIGAMIDHLHDIRLHHFIPRVIAMIILSNSVYVFVRLLPLSYGSSLTRNEVDQLRWKETWQLITLSA